LKIARKPRSIAIPQAGPGEAWRCGLLAKGAVMQMVKIKIADKKESGRALLEMSRNGRVDCYQDNVFIVAEPMLDLLKNLGVSFQELGRGGIDYAEKTLRDTLAAHSQRRPAG